MGQAPRPPETSPIRLEPMEAPRAEQAVALTPMETVPESSPTALTAMEEPPVQQAAVPLEPMVAAVAESPTTLTAMVQPQPAQNIVLVPYHHPDQPEIAQGSSNRSVSDRVAPLAPLAPLTPPAMLAKKTNQKPVVLKGPEQEPRPVIAAGGGTVLTSGTGPDLAAAYAASPAFNQLTDNELSPNPNIPTMARPDEQQIVVDVILNSIRRKSLLNVYQDDHQVLWYPLADLARLLEIPLKINSAAGVAQGWYQSPDNKLLINMAAGTITLGDKTFPLRGNVEKQAADLYISHVALKEWLGVDSTLNYSDLRLSLTTPQPLPGDVQAERYATWDDTEKRRLTQRMPSDTLIPGYADFSYPVMRVGLGNTYTRSSAGSAAVATGLTIQAENDIYGMNSNVALSFGHQFGGNYKTDSGLTGGNIMLSKRSPYANLLGPLSARYFALGDINTQPLPLSGVASRGRGVTANNLPQGTVNNPDQYILTGPAPINWDVEVYQNASLIAYSRVDTTGTYRFTALPLKAGRNTFRIVLYGPAGEREERRETIYLANSVPGRGEVQYDTAIMQPGRSIIPGQQNQNENDAVVAQTQFIAGLGHGWAASMGAFKSVGEQTAYGLMKPEDQGMTTGLRGSIGGTYLTADGFVGSLGKAMQSSIRTPLTQNIDLRLSDMRSFDYDPEQRDELSKSQAEITIPFYRGRAVLDTGYGYTHTTYQKQEPRNDYSQRTTLAMGPFNASNQLNYSTQGQATRLNGTFDTTLHVLGNSVRGGLLYQPQSQDVLRSFYLNGQVPITDRQTLNLTYNQQLTGSNLSSLAGSMYWNTGPFAFGLQSQFANNGNMQVGLNMTTALVPQGYREPNWKLASPNASIGQGQGVVRVYGDENNNNQYDIGEPLLPGVTVHNRQRGSAQVTNAKGEATFTDLTPNTLARLDLDLTTLPDIYLRPVSETLNVKPHRGDNGVLEYAIKLYGEISGQTVNAAGTPVQNVTINLRNTKGEKIDNATTDSEGYYTFGSLPLGSYALALDVSGTTPDTVTLTAKTRIKTVKLVVDPAPQQLLKPALKKGAP